MKYLCAFIAVLVVGIIALFYTGHADIETVYYQGRHWPELWVGDFGQFNLTWNQYGDGAIWFSYDFWQDTHVIGF